MIVSVTKYKGFYIGRFETSGLKDEEIPKVQKDQIPTVEANWYTMYKNSKKIAKLGLQASETSSVTSSMIWGCQWDACMKWFISCGGKTADFVKNSEGKGNYKGTLDDTNKVIPTGSNEAYAVNKIYDMAGNVNECTLEAINNTNGDRRVVRGR